MSVENFTEQKLKLDSIREDNKQWFLPEQVFVSLPQTITEGKKITILVGKQISDNSYKQIQVEYDVTGNLTNLVSEVYQLDK